MKNKIHIVPHDGEWAIRISGSDDPVATEPTQQAAIELAMELAADKELDVVVHRRDGSFRNVIDYESIERRRAAAGDSGGQGLFGNIDGKDLFWGIFAVGAVTGLAVYFAMNPPKEAQRMFHKLEKKRPDWMRFS